MAPKSGMTPKLETKAKTKPTVRVRIWDRPIRIFHWAIVILIALAWWTAQAERMEWHRSIGYAIAGLLVFRLWWGFAGSSTARFGSFLKGPRAVAVYGLSLLKPQAGSALPSDNAPGENHPDHRSFALDPVGHNPMGGWSVVGLLFVLLAEVGFGLFSVDVDGEASGPFSDAVSFDAGRVASHWHHLLFNGLFGLVGLHLVAIAFYTVVKRDNLIGPMVMGSKIAPQGAVSFKEVPHWRFWFGAIISLFVAMALAEGFHLKL